MVADLVFPLGPYRFTVEASFDGALTESLGMEIADQIGDVLRSQGFVVKGGSFGLVDAVTV